ncbi:hypothetical protein SAMN05216550_123108 [Paraburkholderia tropica]|uniref:Uncharacterized protein n=1 Tax=Paraburkholderia tropica TaxID=92647 RepID=A0AAQ1GML1_9BURK|nr:hypothetical protein SAMN05216550_123108 [Paraburkholderia tropica]
MRQETRAMKSVSGNLRASTPEMVAYIVQLLPDLV